MRGNPHTSTHLMRLQEAELRRNVEQARLHRTVGGARMPIARRLVIAAAAVLPIIVAIVNAAPRISFR